MFQYYNYLIWIMQMIWKIMFKRELVRILQLLNTNNTDNMKNKKNLN